MKDIALRDLARIGYAPVPSIAGIKEAVDFLMSRPVFVDAHVPQTARNRGDHVAIPRSAARAAASECVCVHTDDAIVAPHLFEAALDLTDVAAAFLGRDPPICYSANAFWTRPGPAAARPDIQGFHRDQDDARFLAMFVYLTDVLDLEDGPHEMIGPDGLTRCVYGRAGTVFLANTSNEHRGYKPTSKERGIAWFRWGVSDRPAAGQWDNIAPVSHERLGARYPQDSRLRESMRLLVTPPPPGS